MIDCASVVLRKTLLMHLKDVQDDPSRSLIRQIDNLKLDLGDMKVKLIDILRDKLHAVESGEQITLCA